MTDNNEHDRKKLSLSGKPGGSTLGLKKGGTPGADAQVRQSFPHGRTKTVQVEVKRNRTVAPPGGGQRPGDGGRPGQPGPNRNRQGNMRALTADEKEARLRVLREAMAENAQRAEVEAAEAVAAAEAAAAAAAAAAEAAAAEPEPAPVVLDDATRRRMEEDERRAIEEEERLRAEAAERKRAESEALRREAERGRSDDRRGTAAGADRGGPARPGLRPTASATPPASAAERTRPGVAAATPGIAPRAPADDDEDNRRRGPGGKAAPAKPAASPRKNDRQRGGGKLTVSQALSDDGAGGIRARSLASMRRANEKAKRQQFRAEAPKVVRDVVIPETITVQELASRMAERGADVIKALMRSGVMATINQTIDADTAELIVAEFGHRVRRVSESDVLLGLTGEQDEAGVLQSRPPVVTIMGHVDHGKTSLLDALRQTDVAAREAGGITQHIGAYQVTLETGAKITFIDTPGHAAFTEMRSRGAKVTDVVVLVVAANDGVMPQTVEAINHAKAAGVPIIVAINKIDLPDAKSERVRNELLQHGLVTEELGGDILAVEVSAKAKIGLERLEEAILLQAEILELRANPERAAEGVVIEARLERGRGSVATVLVQKGTLKVGDIFVTGSEWGRVRALVDDRGRNIDSAGPGTPVEVLGLSGTPMAGDDLVVVDSEPRAREVAEFRLRKRREAQAAAMASGRGTLEQMFNRIREGESKDFPVVIKGDVQGSIEAISAALERLTAENTEIRVRTLHQAVGPITESDITLANASKAMIIGFNVRANPQARDMARRDGVEINYYSVIYDVLDDVKAAVEKQLSPQLRERYLGKAQIRQVFDITKVGKVAGCMITEGLVKRGARVRLLRDNVVIHEGTLKTLKRFKDEVKEVREGYECGMAFEHYDNIKEGDEIEAFEIEEIARTL